MQELTRKRFSYFNFAIYLADKNGQASDDEEADGHADGDGDGDEQVDLEQEEDEKVNDQEENQVIVKQSQDVQIIPTGFCRSLNVEIISTGSCPCFIPSKTHLFLSLLKNVHIEWTHTRRH